MVLPTAVFWPGEFLGLYSPWGRKESDMTERLSLSEVKTQCLDGICIESRNRLWRIPSSCCSVSSTLNIVHLSSFERLSNVPPWAALVPHTVQNLSAVQKTGFIPWVRKVRWRRGGCPLHCSRVENPWTEQPVGCSPWGHTESDTTNISLFLP